MMKNILIFLLTGFMAFTVSCENLVKVDPPVTSINNDNLFLYDPVVIAAATGIYATMSSAGFGSADNIRALNAVAALYTDELSLFASPLVPRVYQDFFSNNLSGQVNGNGGSFWTSSYITVFRCNSIIKGLLEPNSLSAAVSKQLMGEMLFTRALHYYYLINLYGDVAWIDGVDYTSNAIAKRVSSAEILKHLVADLVQARDLLSTNFLDATLLKATSGRFRPTSFAASTLLVKVYLLQQNWDLAETEADKVINNSQLFTLDSLNSVSLVTGKEAIWQLQVVAANSATEEGNKFILPSTGAGVGNPLFLNKRLLNAFEKNDRRRQVWIGSAGVYNYPYKYKVATATGAPTEALTIFRLADVYLNRAEARAQVNKLDLALEDLNKVRTRAWLPKVVNVGKDKILDTILHERQVELFTEFGNRFIDLKRYNKIDQVMSDVCIEKGTVWKPHYAFFPLSASELQANPNITQTPGY